MKEIDIILIELHRLLTEVKDEGGSDELRSEIQELFARAIPLLMEIDDLDEMDRIHKNAFKVAGMASYLIVEKSPEIKEFLSLLGIEEIKN